MKTAREQEAALDPRRRGAKQAQIIRAEADAQAANTYANSFGKDPGLLRLLSCHAGLSADLRRRGGKARPTNVSFSQSFLRDSPRGGAERFNSVQAFDLAKEQALTQGS
jgi:membrane protease subunit HflC